MARITVLFLLVALVMPLAGAQLSILGEPNDNIINLGPDERIEQNVTNIFQNITNIGGLNNTEEPWLFVLVDTIFFNDTLLNFTIDQKIAEIPWLYNQSVGCKGEDGFIRCGQLNITVLNTGVPNQPGININSRNNGSSVAWFTGNESGKGTVKITHNYPGGDDSNAAAISIDLSGEGTQAQGIFIDAPDGTTGNLFVFRNGSNNKLVVRSDGTLEPEGSIRFEASPTSSITNLRGIKTISSSSFLFDLINNAQAFYRNASNATMWKYNNSDVVFSQTTACPVLRTDAQGQLRCNTSVIGGSGGGSEISNASLNATYLRLDASNDPITEDLTLGTSALTTTTLEFVDNAGAGNITFNNNGWLVDHEWLANNVDLGVQGTGGNLTLTAADITSPALVFQDLGQEVSMKTDSGTNSFIIKNSGGVEEFVTEMDNAQTILYNDPSAGNDFKVFQVFSKQATTETEFTITKAGYAHTSYFVRSLALVGNDSIDSPFNCTTYAKNIDCSTDGTGPDLWVRDDIELNGTLYVGDSTICDNDVCYSLVDLNATGGGGGGGNPFDQDLNTSDNVTFQNLTVNQLMQSSDGQVDIAPNNNFTFQPLGLSDWGCMRWQASTEANTGKICKTDASTMIWTAIQLRARATNFYVGNPLSALNILHFDGSGTDGQITHDSTDEWFEINHDIQTPGWWASPDWDFAVPGFFTQAKLNWSNTAITILNPNLTLHDASLVVDDRIYEEGGDRVCTAENGLCGGGGDTPLTNPAYASFWVNGTCGVYTFNNATLFNTSACAGTQNEVSMIPSANITWWNGSGEIQVNVSGTYEVIVDFAVDNAVGASFDACTLFMHDATGTFRDNQFICRNGDPSLRTTYSFMREMNAYENLSFTVQDDIVAVTPSYTFTDGHTITMERIA